MKRGKREGREVTVILLQWFLSKAIINNGVYTNKQKAVNLVNYEIGKEKFYSIQMYNNIKMILNVLFRCKSRTKDF